MAFPRPSYDNRSPQDSTHQKSRPSWESAFTSSALRSQPPSSVRPSTSTHLSPDQMDPESSDSDVSVSPGDNYRFGSPCAVPAPLPAQPSKHALESSDAVQGRLRDLSRVEDYNIKKQERLQAKRRRKDEKIARKREIQDRKIKAIMDARERRDTRIAARRTREDTAFKKLDDQIEEEEMNLRRRLKRLKRGLPLDESPQPGRSLSSVSMSPPGPSFSTIPPPAKRHQSGPPGKQDTSSPILNSRPQQSAPAAVPQNGPSAPQYSFYQSGSHTTQPPTNQATYQPYSNYHSSPGFGVASSSAPPASITSASRPSNNSVNERSPFNLNGRPASPPARNAQSAPVQTPNSTNPPARQTTSNYDTKPPPSSSGFASINAPPASGFAAINPRSVDTPPTSHATPVQQPDGDNKIPLNTRLGDSLMNDSRGYGFNGTPSGNVSSAPTSGKRTPSTTHPYQMSEAFANRHHHCERVDGLNRGIWTSYGPMGTQEAPTGPAVEMYLRCNHDGCKRIDWRTVHGLQCHIVKNHDQPKGTIGSLEKALDRYGVPVSEIEEYEREHGEGTAGTMADPKNLKIKTKTREASATRAGSVGKNIPASYNIDPSVRPAGYKPSPTSAAESPINAHPTVKSPSIDRPSIGFGQTEKPLNNKEAPVKTGPSPATPSTPVQNHKFEVGRTGLVSPRANAQYPQATGTELSKLQGDAVMKDAGPTTSGSPTAQRVETASFWRNWPASITSTTTPRPGGILTKPEQSPKRPEAKPFSRPDQAPKLTSPVSTVSSVSQANKPGAPPPSPKVATNTNATEPWPALPRRVSVSSTSRKGPAESPKPAISRPGTAESIPTPAPRSRSGTGETKTKTEIGFGLGSGIPNNSAQKPVNKPAAATMNEGDLTKQANVGSEKLVNGEIESSAKLNKTSGAEKMDKPAQINAEKPSTVPTPAKPTENIEEGPKEPPANPGPISRRRSTIQSPIMTNKTIPTPNSAKRGSRRSSTVRKLSIDGVGPTDTTASSIASNAGSKEIENSDPNKDKDKDKDKEKEKEDDKTEEEEGDTIVVSSNAGGKESLKEKEREPARTPPRRNTAGRFTRRSKA